MRLRTKIIQKFVDLNEEIFFYPKLKKFYLEKFSSGSPGIIDVGVNRGQTIDFFLKINSSCRIIGFEPNTRLYDFLLEKYKGYSNIKLYNMGISHTKGRRLFKENVMDLTSSFEELNYSSEYLKKKARILGVRPSDIVVDEYEVNVIDLHSFISEHCDFPIDLVKFDVEGHELACLQGLLPPGKKTHPVDYIQIESHTDDMYKDKRSPVETEQFLAIHGYTEVIKIKHGFGEFYEIIYYREGNQ